MLCLAVCSLITLQRNGILSSNAASNGQLKQCRSAVLKMGMLSCPLLSLPNLVKGLPGVLGLPRPPWKRPDTCLFVSCSLTSSLSFSPCSALLPLPGWPHPHRQLRLLHRASGARAAGEGGGWKNARSVPPGSSPEGVDRASWGPSQ